MSTLDVRVDEGATVAQMMMPSVCDDKVEPLRNIRERREAEYERVMRDIARCVAHALNARTRVRVSSCGVEVSKEVAFERVSSIMGTRGALDYERIMKHHDKIEEHYNFVCDLYYPMWTLCQLASNLPRGSTIDLSKVMQMVFFAKQAFNKHYVFACGGNQRCLMMGQLCEKLRKVCGPDAREWTRRAVGLALSTYSHGDTDMEQFMSRPALVRNMNSIAEVVLSVTVHSKAVCDEAQRRTHHAHLIERLEQLAIDAEAMRNTEFRKELIDLHARVDAFQRLVTCADIKRIESMLRDEETLELLQHPPPVFVAALGDADAERCLSTLRPIFDASYPDELRLPQVQQWRTMYAEHILEACTRARTQLNRAPPFPPEPPLSVRSHERLSAAGATSETPTATTTEIPAETGPNPPARHVPMPQFVHTHCAREYCLPMVSCRKVTGTGWEALARVARTVAMMLRHGDVLPYHCNASIVHSVCMISLNEQQYATSIMRGRIDQWQVQHNMDYVLTAAEMCNWDMGAYADTLSEACAMLHSTSTRHLIEFCNALFCSSGELRPFSVNSPTRCLLNDVGVRIGTQLDDTQHFSRRFVARGVAMVLRPLIHMRQHRALMRNVVLDQDPFHESCGEWSDQLRHYFDYLCTDSRVRERLMRRYKQARVQDPQASDVVELSVGESRDMPQLFLEWMQRVSAERPGLITFVPTRKRSRQALDPQPRIRIHMRPLLGQPVMTP